VTHITILSHFFVQLIAIIFVSTSLLCLGEIDNLLRQLPNTSQKNLVSFADLPHFLTTDLLTKFASIPSLATTLDALKDGFPRLIELVIDYHFANSGNLQLQLLFTLPTLDQQDAICTMEKC